MRISDPSRDTLGLLYEIYEGVASIEGRLGLKLPVHAPPVTGDEIQELGHVLAILQDGLVPITFQEARGEAPAALAAAETARLPNHPPFVFPVKGSVFGTEISLGSAVAAVPDVRVVEIPRLTITPNPTVKLKIFAVGGGTEVIGRLLREGEKPPADAIHAPRPRT